MCDPLTIAGAALTVGSTVANASAARKAEAARNDALAAERIRQGALDQEAQALNTQSQDRFTDFETKREDKATALGDYFAPPTENTEANNAAAVLPAETNSVITREMAKKSGEARAFTDQQGAALAELRSFGDLLGDTSRMQGRDASLVGQIGGFKRGSSNVLPLELEAAAKKGQGMRVLGDILGGIGGIAMNAGLTGGKLNTGGSGSLFGGNSWGGVPKTSATPVARAAAAPATLYPQQRFGGIY